MNRARGDHGQALLAVVLVMVVAVLVVVLTTRLGVVVTDRARARTAADAAALAGATGGRDAAEQIALEDGGLLEEYVQRDSEVEVTVRVGDMTATSRARLETGVSGR